MFTEDVNEPVYKIDRAFAQLSALPEFCQKIRGIVAGDFSGLENSKELLEVLEEYSKMLKCPLWKCLKWGHEYQKVTVPIGKRCTVNWNKIKF